MKFGLKLWSTDTELIDQTISLIDEKVFDYIELFVIPGTQISPFMIDIPYIIHIPHEKFGVNIGERSKKEYNLQKIKESIAWADKLNAEYLILHPGHGSMEDATDVMREVTDSRLLIENMPKVGLNDEPMIGYTPEQIKKLMGERFGLCLDLNHAIKAAVSLGRHYKEFIEEFLKLKLRMFHISDGKLNNEKDEHLNIGEGEYDFEFFGDCIKTNNLTYVTLETPRLNQDSLEEDVKNINALKKHFDFNESHI
ncbi:MAG: TIM barrel protein [Halobacteriota archaeon]